MQVVSAMANKSYGIFFFFTCVDGCGGGEHDHGGVGLGIGEVQCAPCWDGCFWSTYSWSLSLGVVLVILELKEV